MSGDFWAHLDKAFSEQMAGLTKPETPRTDEADTRARACEATPIPHLTGRQGREL